MTSYPPPPALPGVYVQAGSVPAPPPATTGATKPDAPATLRGQTFLTSDGDLWKLAWHDEFDGSGLDGSKWSGGLPWKGDDGTNRHHNSQYASVIADPDVSFHGGSLHLTTRRTETPNPRGGAYHFTEGLITTSGKFSQTFGYFEMRAKLPTEAGPGTWPAFWLLTEGWPPEMDILEYWGSENQIHQGTVTRGADGKQHWDSYHRKNASMSGWHTFGLEWGPGYQIYNIDGVRTNSIFGGYLPTTPHYVLLNSGIETARPPQAGTAFPNDFTVDWVRVYARPDLPSLIDGGFEAEDPRPWQFDGEAAVVDYGAQFAKRCLRLDGGDTKPAMARQTVYGLKPSTRYNLSAFVRTSSKNAALTASDFDAAATVPASSLAQTSGNYSLTRVSFTTGPKAASVVVTCEAAAGATAFFDDVRLTQDLP